MRVGVLRPAQGDRDTWSSIPVSPSLCYQNVTSLSPDLWLLLMDTGDSSAYISAARWGGSLLSHYSHLLIASAGSPGVDQHIFQCTVGNKKLCWYPNSKRDLIVFSFCQRSRGLLTNTTINSMLTYFVWGNAKYFPKKFVFTAISFISLSHYGYSFNMVYKSNFSEDKGGNN